MNHDPLPLIANRLTAVSHQMTMFDELLTWAAPLADEAAEFEACLASWQAGEPLAWAELMAAWVKLPTAPVSRLLVLRLIMGLMEK